MTNYTTYPGWRFCSNSCIIHFNKGDYSWCTLYEKQKIYLVESKYLENAKQVDIKLRDGKVYELPVEAFKEWVNSGKLSEQYLKKTLIAKDEKGDDRMCPLCGKTLVVRTARQGKNAGKHFLGCSGFPNCKHTESID